jgi:hypothetical protein
MPQLLDRPQISTLQAIPTDLIEQQTLKILNLSIDDHQQAIFTRLEDPILIAAIDHPYKLKQSQLIIDTATEFVGRSRTAITRSMTSVSK